MHMESKFKYPPIEALKNSIGLKEIIILNGLKDGKDHHEIAKDLEAHTQKKRDQINVSELIKKMKQDGVFDSLIPNVNPVKIWNHYYFVFLKIGLIPPIMGPKNDYPKDWSEASRFLLEEIFEDEENESMVKCKHHIRQLYGLQGIDWDFMLIATVNDRNDMKEIVQIFTDYGFIAKSWTFEAISGLKTYFDPVGFPKIKEFKEGMEWMKKQ